MGLAGTVSSPPLVRGALAYLQFMVIRPFAFGNEAIAGAVADVVIGRGTGAAAAPYVSLAHQLELERADHDAALARAVRGEQDVTAWAAWFIACYARATMHALEAVVERLRVGKFWRDIAGVEMNARQRRVLERYLAADAPDKISSRTYSLIAQTSTDSAQRDLADLAKKQIIVPNGGRARKTSYRLRDDFFVGRSVEIGTAPEVVSEAVE
jgi:Fic family protein